VRCGILCHHDGHGRAIRPDEVEARFGSPGLNDEREDEEGEPFFHGVSGAGSGAVTAQGLAQLETKK
jgi:hypothetical protein